MPVLPGKRQYLRKTGASPQTEAPEAAKTPANTEDLIASLMAAESEPAIFYADPAFELAVFSSMIDTKLAKDEINATML